MRPLDGLIVLDLTRLLPGAAATLMLANFGAEVIKIEQPGQGDYARWMPPYLEGQGAVFQLMNRGKKSVVLDLKSEEGRAAFRRLCARADVLVESFRPGAMARLGLDYETLRRDCPRLIYAAISGYGQHGPHAGMAGHDLNYMAMGGALDRDVPGVQVADLAAGAMQAVTGILLALEARQRTGEGQMVDVSMLAGVASLLAVPLACWAATGRPPQHGEGVLAGEYACYRLYRAADGRRLAVGALEPKFWATLCRALECEAFIADQFAPDPRRGEIIAALEKIFATRPAAEWFQLLRGLDACVTPVRDAAEVAREFGLRPGDTSVIPLLSATPGCLGGPAPRLGEHTREVLGEPRS